MAAKAAAHGDEAAKAVKGALGAVGTGADDAAGAAFAATKKAGAGVAPTSNTGQLGSYTNTHASGATYSGKGTRARSQQSGRRQARAHDDPHVATDFTPAENAREALKQESRRIDAHGGVSDPSNYNQIESPGRRFRIEDGELLE